MLLLFLGEGDIMYGDITVEMLRVVDQITLCGSSFTSVCETEKVA